MPLIAAQAYLVAFLFMPMHETAHKTAFRSRALNLAVGHMSAFMIAHRYEYYCLFHWDHHRYTQDPVKDPELIVGLKPSSDTQLAIAYTGLFQLAGREWLLLRHALTGKVALPWVPENKRDIIVREARALSRRLRAAAAISLALHTAILLWVWIYPAADRPVDPASLSLCRAHRMRTDAQRI